MEYGFVSSFRLFILFMAKKHDLSEKKFFVCHAPLPLVLDEICLDATEVALKARKLKFWLPEFFVST
jgi:hypothetical protein